MPDLFEEQTSAADFSLPGDEQLNEMIASAEAQNGDGYQPADAAEPAEPEEAAGEAERAQERPRDELGRFTATDADRAAEDEQAAALEDAEEQVEEAPAGRYRTLEEAERAKREADQVIGRMSNELGELREMVRQMQALAAQPPPQPAPYMTQDALADAIDENPILIADQALRTGDQQFLERVVNTWRESDPTSAQLWVETRQAQRQAYEAAQRAEQAVSAAAGRQSQDAIAQAWTQLQAELPDLEQHRGAITAEAQRIADTTGRNLVTEMLNSGDPGQIRDALETLYYRARGRGSDTLAEAARSAAREHVAESQRAKAEAVVASASATGEAPPKSVADQIADSWVAIEQPMRDGWSI